MTPADEPPPMTPADEPEPWPEVCSEEEIEHEDPGPDSDIRHVREQLRQLCGTWTTGLDQLLAVLVSIENKLEAGNEVARDSKAALNAQLVPIEKTGASTKYLADVFRGEAEEGPAALPVDPGAVTIDSGIVEVSNPPDVESVVFATEQAEETVQASMWGLAGLAVGFGLMFALMKVVRP